MGECGLCIAVNNVAGVATGTEGGPPYSGLSRRRGYLDTYILVHGTVRRYVLCTYSCRPCKPGSTYDVVGLLAKNPPAWLLSMAAPTTQGKERAIGQVRSKKREAGEEAYLTLTRPSVLLFPVDVGPWPSLVLFGLRLGSCLPQTHHQILHAHPPPQPPKNKRGALLQYLRYSHALSRTGDLHVFHSLALQIISTLFLLSSFLLVFSLLPKAHLRQEMATVFPCSRRPRVAR